MLHALNQDFCFSAYRYITIFFRSIHFWLVTPVNLLQPFIPFVLRKRQHLYLLKYSSLQTAFKTFISSYPVMKQLLQEHHTFQRYFPTGIYLLRFNNRNTTTKCEISSKLTLIRINSFCWHLVLKWPSKSKTKISSN